MDAANTPRTAAGRALLDEYPGVWYWRDERYPRRWEGPLGPAIEAEAAAPTPAEPLVRGLEAIRDTSTDPASRQLADSMLHAIAAAPTPAAPLDRDRLAYMLATHLCYTAIDPDSKAIDVLLARWESYTPEKEQQRQDDLALARLENDYD